MAHSKSTRSPKPKLRMVERGYPVDRWPLCARICTRPENYFPGFKFCANSETINRDPLRVYTCKKITYARTHTHTHARTHTRTHTCTHARTHAHAHTHTHTYTHIHIHTHTRAHTHAHTHARTRTHAHARTHAPTYARTHARTHTHTHARPCESSVDCGSNTLTLLVPVWLFWLFHTSHNPDKDYKIFN